MVTADVRPDGSQVIINPFLSILFNVLNVIHKTNKFVEFSVITVRTKYEICSVFITVPAQQLTEFQWDINTYKFT